MAITESFRKTVLAEDVCGIRIMMKDSLLVDPTFREFHAMEALAQGITGLYDRHDGRDFLTESASWNDEYMNKIMVQMVGNFSRERIDHLKAIVQHLRPVKVSPQEKATNSGTAIPRGDATRCCHEQRNADAHDRKIVCDRGIKITAGAVAGGVGGGAIATAVGGSFVAGVVVGTVVGAAVVVLITGGGR